MAFPPHLEKLIQQVVQKTREGKLTWHETPEKLVFGSPLAAGWVTVSYQGGVYRFGIRNDEFAEIDGIGVAGGTEFAVLRDLFEMSRRKALNVDQTVEQMLKEIQGE